MATEKIQVRISYPESVDRLARIWAAGSGQTLNQSIEEAVRLAHEVDDAGGGREIEVHRTARRGDITSTGIRFETKEVDWLRSWSLARGCSVSETVAAAIRFCCSTVDVGAYEALARSVDSARVRIGIKSKRKRTQTNRG